MKSSELKHLYLHRYDRRDLMTMVFTNRQLIDWVESQILQWGNIEGKAGCVYNVTCTNKEAEIKAQYVLNLYFPSELTGWDAPVLNERKYNRENKIKIYVKDVEDYYQAQIGKPTTAVI